MCVCVCGFIILIRLGSSIPPLEAEIFPTGLQLQDLLRINNMLKVELAISLFNTMGANLFFIQFQ